MDFNNGTEWMSALAAPEAFVPDGAQRAARAAAVQQSRRLAAMIRLLCAEPPSALGTTCLGAEQRLAA